MKEKKPHCQNKSVGFDLKLKLLMKSVMDRFPLITHQ